MSLPTYNYTGGAGISFSFISGPIDTTPENNIALCNLRPIGAGSAWVEILANTNLDLNIPYSSYSTEALDLGNITQGTFFNYQYARVWYGVNTKSVSTGTNQLNINTSYYSSPPSDVDYSWTPVTDSYIDGDQIIDISGNLSIYVPKDSYLVLLITGPVAPSTSYDYTASLIFTNLPSANGVCFGADTPILMGDNTYKLIKDIQRGDEVMQDSNTKTKAIVSNVHQSTLMTEMVSIPAGLMGNVEEIICTQLHPIWVENDTKRVYAKDLEGVKIISGAGQFFNLQYDEEGTFIADGIKVDSLSPYHKYIPLPKDLFIDASKYIEGKKVKDENDPTRNKPLLELNKQNE
jgi:hypothetical protein